MTASTDVTRFHLSLNVSDLERGIQFFERVLGEPPIKRRADYAKFEPVSPPLVLSLTPHAPVAGGALNHAGFRFPDVASLTAAQARLEQAGFAVQREEGVECCYAKQTKFWVRDPDNTLWEFYVLEGNLDHRGAGQSVSAMPAAVSSAPAASAPPAAVPVALDLATSRVWEHRMTQPFAMEGVEPGSLDEVRLRGTFNDPHTAEERLARLREAYAALRPGGTVLVHVLTTDVPLESPPQLPGGAAYVRHVPVREEILRAAEAAGFEDLQLTTFRPTACFEQEGKSLRETKVLGRRPETPSEAQCAVVFKGPFLQITDDAGTTWRRGVRTFIPLSRWEVLEQSGQAGLFVKLAESPGAARCST